MIWYFVQQYRHSQSNIVSEAMKQDLIKKSIRNGLVNISGVLCSEIEVIAIPEIVMI
jgi:singapore isolate B (sub-type 7) whole genome shotgun sequence assembly, scaffold_1